MPDYTSLLTNPSGLQSLLDVADADDLCVLCDYITDSGHGRLSLDSDVNRKLSGCRTHKLFRENDRSLIAEEILLFGGNTVVNLYRGFLNNSTAGSMIKGVLPSVSSTITYSEVVTDVAEKCGAHFDNRAPSQDIELAILLRIFNQAFEKMSEQERKQVLDELGISTVEALRTMARSSAAGAAASFVVSAASLRIASMVAAAVARQMLGRAAVSAAAFAGSRGVAALAGPIGLAVSALWTLADLSSPAYRVTLPCVVQIAYMRQKYLADLNSNKCAGCSADNAPKAKFCCECGTPLAKVKAGENVEEPASEAPPAYAPNFVLCSGSIAKEGMDSTAIVRALW